MTLIEDRHGFSPDNLTPEGYQAKHDTRLKNLALIRASDYWIPDNGGYLNGDWIELCGHQDETLRMLLDAKALRPGKGKYIGVNSDEGVLAANEEHYKAETEAGLVEWVHGEWANVITNRSRFPNVRVIFFDSFNSLANLSIDSIQQPSKDLAEYLYERNGAVLLVLNFSLRGTTDTKRVKHTKEAYNWQRWLCPGNRTRPDVNTYTSRTTKMHVIWMPLGF